jgi:putative peptide zinc metalloprotease protein
MSEARPAIRPGLHFVRKEQGGAVTYVVKDPVSMKYFRFGEVEVGVLKLLDGSRALSEVASRLRAEYGAIMSPTGLETFVRRLKEMGLVQRTQDERSALLMESLRRQRELRVSGHGSTLLRMRFSFGDPDAVFGRMVPPLGFLWTRGFVILSLGLFAAYLLIITLHWDRFASGTARLLSPSEFTPGLILAVYTLTIVITIVHELGHGLTCKRMGGEVHEWGAMLFYFSPAFYCNVNDAWTFEKRSERLWVTFAGGFIELLLAAVAAIFWLLLEPGTLLAETSFLVMLLAGGLVLLLNFNPLIPLDGYYALVDWLDIPNLRNRSFTYVGARFRRDVLRLDVPVPPVTPREGRIFLTYGLASIAYTTVLLVVVSIWLGGLLVGAIGGWGWAVIAFMLLRFGGARGARAAAAIRDWSTGRGAALRRGAGILAGAILLLAATLALPWTVKAAGSAVIEPAATAWLRPPEDARVTGIMVREGDVVEAGAPVARLVSPELELERARAAARVAALGREAGTARGLMASDRAALRTLELEAAQVLLAQVEARRAALHLHAPFRGRVLTPRLEERINEGVPAGEPLVEMAGVDAWRVRVVLPSREAGGIHPGAITALRFPAAPQTTWRTQVVELAPAAAGGEVILFTPMPADAVERQFRAGMSGRARVVVQRTTVGGALLRAARRTIRTDVLL